MEEKKFPIYRYWANYKYDNMPYNLKKDGFSSTIMFKEYQSEEELNNLLKRIIQQHVFDKHQDKINLVLVDSGIKFVEEESWCLVHFQHITYNLFETDEEVERSFNEFIERKANQNWNNGHQRYESNMNNDKPFYCFMGAEDRWRWNICRCEHCQKAGKITIDH